MKPNCLLMAQTFFVSLIISCIMILSRTLYSEDVSAIGLYSLVVWRFLVYGIGMM